MITKRLDDKIVEEDVMSAEEATKLLGIDNISQIEINEIIEALYEVYAAHEEELS